MEHSIPLIVFLTDFGNDVYSGVMAGKILSINPSVKLVTLSNHVQPQNIKHGSFILKESFRHFPKGTIFLVVVDPGVGGQRKAVALECEGYYFVGPDNGIFYPLIQGDKRSIVVELESNDEISNTFHGRDIFAPSAAKLSQSRDILSLGKITNLEKKLTFHLRDNEGEVVFIDSFGNIITNIPGDILKRFVQNHKLTVYMDDSELKMEIKKYYSEGSFSSPFILVGSFNTLEIALRNGSASEMLPYARSGTLVKLSQK